MSLKGNRTTDVSGHLCCTISSNRHRSLPEREYHIGILACSPAVRLDESKIPVAPMKTGSMLRVRVSHS